MHVIKHFITITSYRFRVMKNCFKCGLYWRGLTHDLSKYSPTEFIEGAKYYVGTRSPISECRKKTGKSEAWLHHKGRNPHHPEYWIDGKEEIMMPYKYVVESVCDKIAAGKTYHKKDYDTREPLNFWYKKLSTTRVHPKTADFFEHVLTDLAIHGENYILNKKYMQNAYQKICGPIKNKRW